MLGGFAFCRCKEQQGQQGLREQYGLQEHYGQQGQQGQQGLRELFEQKGQQECQTENRVNNGKISYDFCEPVTVPNCRENEIASVHVGYRQQIFCKCPEPFALYNRFWDPISDKTEYSCEK